MIENRKYPFWYFLVLFTAFFLVVVFWYMLLSKLVEKRPNHNSDKIGLIVSDNPLDYINLIGEIEPIDQDFVIVDSITKRKVISNIVNIALKDKFKSILEFASEFKQIYSSSDYEITYLDSIINRIQIKLPISEKENFKIEIKKKLNNYKLLVWDETLFSVSNYMTNDPFLLNDKDRWYLDAIQITEAWKKTSGDSDVKIAIIDNGFDLNHPELIGKSKLPYNVVTKNSDVSASLINHGTHVAATAVGKGNNKNGLIGICPDCSFIPIKVEDSQGLMSSSYIIDGILYAIKNDADVINLSLGFQYGDLENEITEEIQNDLIKTEGKDEEEFWNELFEYAAEKNVICVLAAGNNHLLTGIDPFTRSSKTIKVGAFDRNGQIAKFSNFGFYTSIYAPGVDIKSAKPNNGYEYLEGTSMATPILAGFIGLVKSQNKKINNNAVLAIVNKNSIVVDKKRIFKVKSIK
jgi:subtilisin family serine protease